MPQFEWSWGEYRRDEGKVVSSVILSVPARLQVSHLVSELHFAGTLGSEQTARQAPPLQ